MAGGVSDTIEGRNPPRTSRTLLGTDCGHELQRLHPAQHRLFSEGLRTFDRSPGAAPDHGAISHTKKKTGGQPLLKCINLSKVWPTSKLVGAEALDGGEVAEVPKQLWCRSDRGRAVRTIRETRIPVVPTTNTHSGRLEPATDSSPEGANRGNSDP